MVKIVIDIKGPSLHAVVRWDGVERPLTRVGNRYATELGTNAGTHQYIITVWGPTGEAWSASVRRAESPSGRDHEGVMGANGQDTTGHQVFDV